GWCTDRCVSFLLALQCHFFFFSSRRRHTRSVSAFLLNRSSDLRLGKVIEARINLSRFVVTGCAAKTSATVTFPSLNLISLFAFRSEERRVGKECRSAWCPPLCEKEAC